MSPRYVQYRLDELPPSQTDWERVRNTTEEEIAAQAREDGTDFPDDFWDDAVLVVPAKQAVSLRIDADVLTWYRAQGKGYQTRMNRVLRRFMEAQQRRAAAQPVKPRHKKKSAPR
jgi:uncharacterized protein (DUF4415 family)